MKRSGASTTRFQKTGAKTGSGIVGRKKMPKRGRRKSFAKY